MVVTPLAVFLAKVNQLGGKLFLRLIKNINALAELGLGKEPNEHVRVHCDAFFRLLFRSKIIVFTEAEKQ